MIQLLHALIDKPLPLMRRKIARVAAGLLVRPLGNDLRLLTLDPQMRQKHDGKLAGLIGGEMQLPSWFAAGDALRRIVPQIDERTSLKRLLNILQHWFVSIGNGDGALI